jgi:hypothetical protein
MMDGCEKTQKKYVSNEHVYLNQYRQVMGTFMNCRLMFIYHKRMINWRLEK